MQPYQFPLDETVCYTQDFIPCDTSKKL